MTTITLPGRKAFLPILLTTIIGAVFIAGFFPTILSLHLRWTAWTESYSHGYLLIVMAAYLYIESSNVAPRWLPYSPNLSLVVLAVSSLSWLLFYLAGITVLQQMLLPVIVLALASSLLDADRFCRLLVPVSLVYLAIPLWDEWLTTPLQVASAKVSAWVVSNTFGIPTAIDGFHISIPAGTFEVASGCAGVVFFLSAVTTGILYAQLFLQRSRARFLAVVLAAALGILVNWVRIISLIVIGQRSNMKHPLVTEGHLLFGWYLFSGAMLMVILLTLWAARPHPARNTEAQLPAVVISPRRYVLTLLALLAGPLLLLLLRNLTSAGVTTALPHQLGQNLYQTRTQLPGFVKPTLSASYRYTPATDLLVSVVYYSHSFGRGKLISQANRIIPEHAEILEQQRKEGTASLPALLTTKIQSGSTTYLIWSWYTIGDETAAAPTEAKFTQLKQALRGRLKGVYVSIETPCIEPDCLREENILAQHSPAIYREITPLMNELTR